MSSNPTIAGTDQLASADSLHQQADSGLSPESVAPGTRGIPYWARMSILGVIVVAAALGVLLWGIGPEPGTRGFSLILERRWGSLGTIVLVAVCQSIATVLFHTATANRILTPSIMGFESLYVVIQTGMVFFFGAASLSATDGVVKVLLQSAVMVLFATLLYGWLFNGRFGNLHITLLVGLILGAAFGTASTFMQRLLVPTDFDLLSARLFGNISNSNPAYLPYAVVIIGTALVLVWKRRYRLDVLALGRDPATNLGLAYKREVLVLLVLVAVLISISTSLIGPLTFFGFIVATLSYQLAGTSEHRRLLPFAFLLGLATLLVGYFVLHHIFSAAGLLTVIIEFLGGIAFVVVLLRKGSL